MKGIVIIAIAVFIIWLICTFASTRVKKRRVRRDREMITRYIQGQEKRG
jgi:hypothetical protein